MYPDPFWKATVGRERKRLGNAVGLTQFGVNLTTLKPGAWSSQRHWHRNEDEFIYVLEGELVLCEDAGETVLKPGDAAGWKAGCAQRPLPDQPTRPRRRLPRNRHAGGDRDGGLFRHRHEGRARRARPRSIRASRTASRIRSGAREIAMPKIDLSKIPWTNNRVLSEGVRRRHRRAREAEAWRCRGPDAVRRQHRPHQAEGKSALRHWHESEDEFIYMLEGELVLHENDGETVLRAGRRRRLAGQRRHRPLPDQPHRPRRGLSRGRHALEGRARASIPTSISCMERDEQGRRWIAQERRADQGVRGERPMAHG